MAAVPYILASAAQRLVSSSLYLVAALLVYLALWSLLASAAEPPCDWKYLVALSLPPTFIIRNWSHCQTSLGQHILYMVSRVLSERTVEVGGSYEGDMDTHVTMVGRAVET